MTKEETFHTLLTIPEEVVYNCILPFLKQNDLLRLRRVSKVTKRLADDYIRTNLLKTEIEINDTTHTFGDFIERNLPSCSIHLNNTGSKFFEDANIPEFLRLYGSKITHLRVKHFSTCTSEPENAFFLGLTNLQHLELEETDARARKLGYHSRTINGVMMPRELCYFPATFKNLKTLILRGQIEGSELFDQNYGLDIIEFCSNLEHVTHPLYKRLPEGFGPMYRDGPFGCLTQPVKKWLQANSNDLIKLKYYDLDHNQDDPEESLSLPIKFMDMAGMCNEHNIKLLNVNSFLFCMFGRASEREFEQSARPIVSMKNVHAVVFRFELPNLEKLVITSTSKCSYLPILHGHRGRKPKWPKLETLDINIDSGKLKRTDEFGQATTKQLLDVLFGNAERTALKDLRIRVDKKASAMRNNGLPCPSVPDILRNCPNVTKLTLANWQGTEKAVEDIWKELLLLEEVAIEECRTLGDAAFIGENKKDPSFMKLKNLNKFTLCGIDSMPKITDLVFDVVFCHLTVKEFGLTSNTPIRTVTIKGIRSLLSGKFNDFVEKFPFHGWSLENVSAEELNKLKSGFRATHMI